MGEEVTDRFVFMSGDVVTAVDRRTGWHFTLVSQTEFTMGLSDDEQDAARRLHPEPNWSVDEMRPLRRATIGPVLMKTVPLTVAEAGIDGDEPHHPALLTFAEAQLRLTGNELAMPTEAQWEGAVRAGRQTLFPWGDELPPEAELDRWLSWDLSQPDALPACASGLKALFFGEWCADRFVPGGNDHVIRGGGAFFWPWQDEEWVWCACAMRMPSSGLIDGRAALRPVYPLPRAGGARTR